MFVSLNYRIKRHRNRIVLLVFGSIFFVLSFVFLASDLSSRFVFWALTLVVSLFLLPFGIGYTASVGKTKKVLRKGQATYGELANNLWNADRCITFYYKLEDGRIGKVIQQISKRAATKLDEGKFTNIPISILGIRAVFDESRLGVFCKYLLLYINYAKERFSIISINRFIPYWL